MGNMHGIFGKGSQFRRLPLLLAGMSLALVLLGLPIQPKNGNPWDALSGLYGFLGLLSLALLILGANDLRKILMDEDGHRRMK